MTRFREIDIRKLKTVSVSGRKSKVGIDRIAKPPQAGDSFLDFWKSLPSVLAGNDLKRIVDRLVDAIIERKPVLWMMGAHVIKVGLNPVIIHAIENGWIRGLVLNGAGAIHDVEMAYFGRTSEDVQEALRTGRFGTAKETADILNGAADEGAEEELGFGEALGRRITADAPEHRALSVLYRAYQKEIPVTVHVAIGTDIVHQHGSAKGSAIGEVSLRDFRIMAELVSEIGNGGVVLLFGSSVILPEVFIKALNTARNIAGPVDRFTTANFDMIDHYRPRMNVVRRPTDGTENGMSFLGHHEIMLPLLAAAVEEELALRRKK